MINTYDNSEVEKIRESSLLVGLTLAEVGKILRPGIQTKELDKRAEEFIRDNEAIPTFKGYGGFPTALCISINEVVVHGFPSDYEVKDSDIVSIDCGVTKNGFVGDSAYTFMMPNVSNEARKLCRITKESLYLGIEMAIVGNRVGDISWAIQGYCEGNGYGVVRDLCGHGVGRNLHEKPDVPNFGKRGNGSKLKEGMVIAIEPMITAGTYKVCQAKDGWTIYTQDKKLAAHYEHDVVICQGKAEILSSFAPIEALGY
ncbi:MAG: type I methionyl aminopeptidase [Bacteroidales bacterium]|jgi:methionyl aminopeptidase|nr:type I methionyl aminopeptidase [Bacteroidales bacterium]